MIQFIIVFLFIIGLAVGSFLNVVAFRAVHGGSIIFGSSKCPNCKHKLSPADLIPIVSFISLRGRCRYCKKKISIQYPIVEASTGLLFLYAGYYWYVGTGSLGFSFNSIAYLIFLLFIVSILLVLFVTDLVDGLLPNLITLPAVGVVTFYKIYLLASGSLTIFGLGLDLLIALLMAAIFFGLVYFSGERALGGGDVKLAFLIGLAVGWPAILVGLFVGFLTGGIASVMLLLIGKKRFGDTVPLGPFLTIGATVALFWGPQILGFYLKSML